MSYYALLKDGRVMVVLQESSRSYTGYPITKDLRDAVTWSHDEILNVDSNLASLFTKDENITVTIKRSEANWLASVLQNPLNCVELDEEDVLSKKHRASLWHKFADYRS